LRAPNILETATVTEVPYESQTELFRLIGRKDYSKALERLKEAPHEALIWIVTKYKGGTLVGGVEEETIWYRRLPLHHACGQKLVPLELIQALMEAYPESTMEKDETGKVPLIHACRRDAPLDIVKEVLTEETARATDAEGKAALHWACEYRASLEKIKVLVETSREVLELKDVYGRLPMHWECSVVSDRKDKMPVVKYLVREFPEAVSAKDKDGKTPLQMIDLSEVFDFLQATQQSLPTSE
jgi:Ankyrin repeats (3 copies)